MVQTSAPYDANVDEFAAVDLTAIPSERISVPRVESPMRSSAACTVFRRSEPRTGDVAHRDRLHRTHSHCRRDP